MLLRFCEPGEPYVPASEAPLLRTVQAGAISAWLSGGTTSTLPTKSLNTSVSSSRQ